MLREWMKKSGSEQFIRFESIPPYCPDLNPVELFNNEYKGYIKKNLCRNESDVLKATDSFINFYQTLGGDRP